MLLSAKCSGPTAREGVRRRAPRYLAKFLAAALVSLLLCAAALAQTSAADIAASQFDATPYTVGEHLTYTVSFSNFTSAAHVEMLVASRGQLYGREGVELRAHVETLGVVSAALYSLDNSYATFVDPSNGLPYHAQQLIREGARAEDTARDLNTPLGDPATPSRQTVGGTTGAFDFLSALYRLRALPLAPGATYTIAVQNGANVYNAELRVVGRELLKTNVGSSNAIVTQVRVRGNSVADAYRVSVYFTDDERHVPVLITAQHHAGEIRVELASADMQVAPQTSFAAPGTNTSQPPGVTLPPGVPPATTPAHTGAGATPTPGAAAVAPSDLPFKPGEQLNFNFFLGASPQPVGTASFQVRARARYFNRDGMLLTALIQTAGPGQTLFPVNDQISSYVDATSVLPFRSELTLAESKRRARFIVSSDQNGGSALFDDGTRVEMPVGTHDLLSVFYALRVFDLTPGKRNAVSLLVNKRPRLLFITALRRGDVLLGGQQIPAVELSLATNDPDGTRFNLHLWVSTDSRRLPLRLTAQTPLGPVRADLAILPLTLQ
ncbi:MAG TPA: DUF3108 domain-containing protein [Pyrinomonadaceae bacterium]|nr:DUF3108 domain-containing protein [Pyrinomonadaceae bacterium]